MDTRSDRVAFWSRMVCLSLAVLGLFLIAIFSGAATAEGASPAIPSQVWNAADPTLQANRPIVPSPMTLFLLANGAFAGFVVKRMRVSER